MKTTYRHQLPLDSCFTSNGAVYVACVIARTIGKRVPTPKLFMEKYGMNRATAYRWVRAWKDANGVS